MPAGAAKPAAASTGWKRLVLPAALIVIIGPVLEVLSWNFLDSFRDLGYIISLGSLAVFSFYGMWSYEREVRGRSDSIAIRDGIATSVVLVYLVLLSWAIFFGGDRIAPVAEAMLPSFTSLTGVVVAFYFGSIAATEIAKTRQPNKPAPTGQESHTSDKPEDR
jgi:hypothetical protein